MKGKNILITAGPTKEFIDPVRFISNASTGKMGYAIAEELHKRGNNFGDATRKALGRAKFLLAQGKRGEKKFIQKYSFREDDKDDGKQRRK